MTVYVKKFICSTYTKKIIQIFMDLQKSKVDKACPIKNDTDNFGGTQ